VRHPSLVDESAVTLMKICEIHMITFAYKAARIEFARSNLGFGTLYHAFARHWHECLDTRRQYVDQVGDTGFRSGFSFFRTLIHCQYLMVRLLLHFHNKSRQ